MIKGAWLALLTLGLCGCCATRPAATAELDGLPVLIVPHADIPPVVDGVLDDPVWQHAAIIKGLKPSLGGRYQDRIDKIPTTVRVAWDTNNLYVAFECVDSDVYTTGKLKHDDDLYQEDVCEVFIDGKGDGRQYVEIQVSPLGATLDMMYLLTATPEYTAGKRFTPQFAQTDRWCFREWEMQGLQAASKLVMRDGRVVGWTTEIAIPAESIMKRRGKKAYEPCELRANFMRYDWPLNPKTGKRALLHMNWSPVLGGCPHISPAAMGRLELEPPQSTQ